MPRGAHTLAPHGSGPDTSPGHSRIARRSAAVHALATMALHPRPDEISELGAVAPDGRVGGIERHGVDGCGSSGRLGVGGEVALHAAVVRLRVPALAEPEEL